MLDPTIKERLESSGHIVNGEFCEKCWELAALRLTEDTTKSQYEHYEEIVIESEQP